MDPGKLSKRERQIMDVVYAHGEATVSQVLGGLPDAPMRGALRTLLRILERKGHLTHRQVGREFVYRPTQPRGQAGRSALGRAEPAAHRRNRAHRRTAAARARPHVRAQNRQRLQAARRAR